MSVGTIDGFDFPRTPGDTLGSLWNGMFKLLPQLTRVVLHDRAIKTVETPIAHGLKSSPKGCNVLPYADARVWRTRAPDNRFVYLAASAAITADVEIIR